MMGRKISTGVSIMLARSDVMTLIWPRLWDRVYKMVAHNHGQVSFDILYLNMNMFIYA